MPLYQPNPYRYFIIFHLKDGQEYQPLPLPEETPDDDAAREVVHEVKKIIMFEYLAMVLVKQLKDKKSEGSIILLQ